MFMEDAIAPRNKILGHPMKDDIIKWLTQGISVRDVEKRLAEAYPRKNQEHLRISHSTIQAFKGKHLNLKGQVLQAVKEQSYSMRAWAKRKEEEQVVQATTAYQKAIASLAEEELDVKRELLKIFTIIESRIDALFERLDGNDFSNKDVEKSLQGYLDQFMKVLDQHKKYVEGYKETTEHNINITVMNDQVTVLRESIRETMAEVDPGLAIQFMNKLNTKMRDLAYTDDGNAVFLNSALGAKNEY